MWACIFTKPPKKTVQGLHHATTHDLCMEWDPIKVASKPELFMVANGYLKIKLGTRMQGARRQGVWEYVHRVVLNMVDGLEVGRPCVCHTCDNPMCINPMHLLWGTHKSNREARDLDDDGKAAIYHEYVVERMKRWGDRKEKWDEVNGKVCKKRRGA